MKISRASSVQKPRLSRLRMGLTGLLMLGLTACGGTNTTPNGRNADARDFGYQPSTPQKPIVEIDFSAYPTPPTRPPGAVTIGLLLPMNDSRAHVRSLAADLFNAAQLAVFDAGQPNVVLRLHDTRGTPQGATAAAKEAIAAQVDIIVGPLFSSSAKAIGPVLVGRNTPALAFSNDRNARTENIWLLGFLPEENINRVVVETISQGLTRFAALVPEGPYGAVVLNQFRDRVARFGGEIVLTETYPPEAKDMFDPVRRLAQYDRRTQAHSDEVQRLKAEARALTGPEVADEDLFVALRDTAPELVSAHEALTRSETLGDIPYDAVFMPEGGLALRKLAPLLPYFDVDPKLVKFIGSGLWDDPALSQEPPLHGGWYAAPDRQLWVGYQARYERTFSRPAPRLSSISYDAVSLAIRLSVINPIDPFSRTWLTDPNGFSGIDGIFRLTPDGLNERGLAVQEISAKSPRTVDPSPKSFVDYDRRLQSAIALADSLQARAPRPLGVLVEPDSQSDPALSAPLGQ